MQHSSIVWPLGVAALVLDTASIALNILFIVSGVDAIPIVQTLAWIAIPANVVSAIALFIAYVLYYKRTESETLRVGWKTVALIALVSLISSVVAAIALVWGTIRAEDLNGHVGKASSKSILLSWFAVWACATVCTVAAFGFIGWCSQQGCQSSSTDSSSLDFGIDIPNRRHSSRPQTQQTTHSFRSQDPTLTSPPRTPTGTAKSSLRHSSSSNIRPANSRTQLIRQASFPQESARNSSDYAGSEITSVDHGFDRWDTSSVGKAMRETLQSSPPVTRGGLETIPGSRPESPAHPLDGPFLPESPHATTSDAPTVVASSRSRKASFTTPPSSPPNFSRPTSRQYTSPLTAVPGTPPKEEYPLEPPPPFIPRSPTPSSGSRTPDTPEELIHPLFRSSSPVPPPNTSPNTVVTASPSAGQIITPHALTRMRSSSLPRQPSPLVQAESPSDEYVSSRSPEPGSPGPSIIDEEEEDLPPILPGFVLSAGQRSSLVGYGKRKSVKGRSSSASLRSTSSSSRSRRE